MTAYRRVGVGERRATNAGAGLARTARMGPYPVDKAGFLKIERLRNIAPYADTPTRLFFRNLTISRPSRPG